MQFLSIYIGIGHFKKIIFTLIYSHYSSIEHIQISLNRIRKKVSYKEKKMLMDEFAGKKISFMISVFLEKNI